MLIGHHVNRDSDNLSITNYIKKAILCGNVYNIKINTAAIFVSNPRGLNIILKDESEQEELRNFIKKTNINIIAHSSYVAYIWNKKNPKKYMDFVEREYITCKENLLSGLVIHLTKDSILKKKYIKSTIEELINKVHIINENSSENIPIIYLETPAIVPMWASYDTPKKLSALFNIINKINKNHPFGLCIDTAHLWTSGNDISTYEGAKRWFSELMSSPYIPYNNIIIHLNDSANELGHGPDKHESLTHGFIWKDYKNRASLKNSGLYFIIQFAKLHNIPLILERNNKEKIAEDYTVLSKIIHLN
jgi:deoxyribonuclease-4